MDAIITSPPGITDVESSFETMFRTHFKGLHSYASTIVRDDVAGEEIVQQVFCRLWEKRGSLQIDRSLQSYLYRSVYHESLNMLKHEKVRQNHRRHVMAQGEPEFHDTSSSAHKELQQRLSDAINSLPEQCRTIFQLSRFEDMKYREIADRLGISVKTVENQMGKALRLMRIALVDFLPVFMFLFIDC